MIKKKSPQVDLKWVRKIPADKSFFYLQLFAGESLVEEVMIWREQTKEKLFREYLISLGWTPPLDVSGRLDLPENCNLLAKRFNDRLKKNPDDDPGPDDPIVMALNKVYADNPEAGKIDPGIARAQTQAILRQEKALKKKARGKKT